MIATTPMPTAGQLIHAAQARDGAHSSEQLSRAVNRGELLRVQRGVYLEPRVWLASPPWDRFLIATTAAALTCPSAVFCRETALLLHGVPVLGTPRAVQLRTGHNRSAGTQSPSAMTGRASSTVVDSLLGAADEDSTARGSGPGAAAGPHALTGFGLRRHQYPRRMRESLRTGLAPSASDTYSDALRLVQPAAGPHFDPAETLCRTESVELAAVDAVSRMNFEAAVVTLDALQAGRFPHGEPLQAAVVEPWLFQVPSARGRGRWEAAWDFADKRSESVGESVSRVRIHDAGFALPQLQHPIELPGGRVVRPDFFWEEAGVIGEFDGLVKYREAQRLSGADPASVVIWEKEREDLLRSLGLRVVRWTWQDLYTPGRLVTLLARAGVPLARPRFTLAF